MQKLGWLLGLGFSLGGASATAMADTYPSEDYSLEVTPINEALNHPWGMALLPGEEEILVTERDGGLWRIQMDSGERREVSGLPRIRAHGQGGLLDVALHPEFERDPWVYISYAGRNAHGHGTEVLRARLRGQQLQDLEVIFVASGKHSGSRHFGSRLLFDREGHLLITVGDRGQRARAQRADDHAGSVLRIRADGSIPEGNLHEREPSAKPEIYTTGHRNPQGLVRHPETGDIWLHEHGPKGGDELNLIQAHRNYGWPTITYGREYSGGVVGQGLKQQAGLEQPAHYWVPSIAPSGMAVVQGQRFAKWSGNLLIGSLKFQQLVRLQLEGQKVVAEERLLSGELGRIRDVEMTSDGRVLLLTDKRHGGLYQMQPAP